MASMPVDIDTYKRALCLYKLQQDEEELKLH